MDLITFSFAVPSEAEGVKNLLSACELPTDDVSDHLDHFIVAKDGNALVGVIGLEPLENIGLLRSLAVTKPYRRRGLAQALYTRIVAYARQDLSTEPSNLHPVPW